MAEFPDIRLLHQTNHAADLQYLHINCVHLKGRALPNNMHTLEERIKTASKTIENLRRSR